MRNYIVHSKRFENQTENLWNLRAFQYAICKNETRKTKESASKYETDFNGSVRLFVGFVRKERKRDREGERERENKCVL